MSNTIFIRVITGLYRICRRIFSREFPKILLSCVKLILVRINYGRNALVVSELNFNITSRCTLKCSGCYSLMQYYKNAYHLPHEQIFRDYDLLIDRVDFAKKLQITGGEPFMVKDLPKILAHIDVRKNKYGLAKIETNGTILPDKHVLEAVKKYGYCVIISNYGDYSDRVSDLKKALRAHGIAFQTKKPKWFAWKQLTDKKANTVNEVNKLKEKCRKPNKTFMHGRFYYCDFLAHGDALRAIPSNPDNYIDLLDNNVTKENIRSYLKNDTVYPGCKYCSGLKGYEGIPVAEQINKPLEYTVFE